jgi:hypothetical protein
MTTLGEKVLARMSSARRNAESLSPSKKEPASTLKAEQEQDRLAMSAKIARLREARLAKEAEGREAIVVSTKPKAKRVRRRTF